MIADQAVPPGNTQADFGRLEAHVRPLQGYGLTPAHARFEDQNRHVSERLRRDFPLLRQPQ
jgi:hypothetical protein